MYINTNIKETEYKQFVIIPKKPEMSTGKIASQTAHATFMALENQSKLVRNVLTPSVDGKCAEYSEWDNIERWKKSGMCVIVLECSDSNQLMGIAKYLEQWKIPHHLYIDEGMTEVEMGTPTALATGVLPKDYHWMLKQLELYK